MAYHIYQTDAFVVGSSSYGETAKIFILYTEELGLIRASAQGIRTMSSKLRYALDDMSHSRVSLVRGKEYWRITGAQSINVLRPTNIFVTKVYARIVKLIERLIHEEESDAYIYTLLRSFFMHIAKNNANDSDQKTIEVITVARLLQHLGYISPTKEIESVFGETILSEKIIEQHRSSQKKLIEVINIALKASGL